MLVLPAQFLDYKFKLSITLHAAAVVFSAVNQRRKMAFYYNLYLLYCLHVICNLWFVHSGDNLAVSLTFIFFYNT
jgi:hypothetical protein